jgi:(p)ppGpp synthase/HD superfamily hydrolase
MRREQDVWIIAAPRSTVVAMWDPEMYKQALDFAARVHGAQVVPGSGFPYVVHLAKVAAEVMCACSEERGIDATLAVVCALLHDTIEDANVTREQVAESFGARIADGVDALTKREAIPKSERMRDALDRIRAQPREIAMVKLADRITNLEPAPPHWTVEKRVAYRGEAELILETLTGTCLTLERRLKEKISQYAVG